MKKLNGDTKVELIFKKERGYIIYITDNKSMFLNYPITKQELLKLRKILNKRFKKEDCTEVKSPKDDDDTEVESSNNQL